MDKGIGDFTHRPKYPSHDDTVNYDCEVKGLKSTEKGSRFTAIA